MSEGPEEAVIPGDCPTCGEISKEMQVAAKIVYCGRCGTIQFDDMPPVVPYLVHCCRMMEAASGSTVCLAMSNFEVTNCITKE